MKKGSFLFFAFLGLPLILAAAPPEVKSETKVNHSLYGELLEIHVKNGVVDYKGLKDDENKLDQYLKILDQTNPDELPRKEQFSLYINAYNAYTIKLILDNYPVKSIKDIGGLLKSPWKIKFCKIGGKIYTLDEIEHEILRPRYKDPRIHFAVNCASKGCPPLMSEPYRADLLEGQLEKNTIEFLNDPKRNYLDGRTLYVSRIFKWFRGDFEDDIVGFFLKYAQGEFRQRLATQKDRIRVKYLDYDWSLNGH
jgi:hypothetical protein